MKGGKGRILLFTYLSGTAVLAFVLIRLAASVLIRSLGWILSSLGGTLGLGELAETLGQIFGQLSHAEIAPSILIPLLFALAAAVILQAGMKTGRASRIVCSVLGILLLFIPFVLLTVWLTSVNSIRFDGVILSLIRMIRAGALDSL